MCERSCLTNDYGNCPDFGARKSGQWRKDLLDQIAQMTRSRGWTSGHQNTRIPEGTRIKDGHPLKNICSHMWAKKRRGRWVARATFTAVTCDWVFFCVLPILQTHKLHFPGDVHTLKKFYSSKYYTHISYEF